MAARATGTTEGPRGPAPRPRRVSAGGGGQAGGLPGLDAAGEVGRPAQPEVLQRRRRERRGVPLLAVHHHAQVVGRDREPGVAGRIEAPFQVVALHHDRARDDAGGGALDSRADVDEDRAVALGGQRLRRVEPVQTGPCRGEDLVDGTGAGRLHQSRPACSVPAIRSAPPSMAYRVIRVSTGEYTCTLTAGTVPELTMRCTCRAPKRRVAPGP